MGKSIAIIVQKLTGGGAERVAANLSVILGERYNVHLIVFDGRKITYPYAGTLHDLKLPPAKSAFGKAVNVLKRDSAVKSIKKTEHISASISLMDGANLVNILTRHGEKVITSVHNFMSVGRSRHIGFLRVFMRWIAKGSDCVVGVSEGVRKDLIENFSVPEEKTVTIYNPVDPEAVRKSAGQGTRGNAVPTRIITMGRLDIQKGQWHLLRAFASVHGHFPETELYILGNGQLRERLESLSEDLGISGSVRFMGFVNAPYPLIRESAMFVLSSLFEGFGNVLVEAMSCGAPCISTDCSAGPREILAPGTAAQSELERVEYAEYGILTCVDTAEFLDARTPLTKGESQLAEAMEKLLTDPELRERYSARGWERVQAFSPGAILREWEKLLEEQRN